MNYRRAAFVYLPLLLTSCGGGSGGSDSIDKVIGSPPTITIAWPADNSHVIAPSVVDIIASASDTGGSVTEVEFFANGQSLGRTSSAPYTFRWFAPPAGSHVLTAVAQDDDGNTATSPPTDVVIEGAANRRPSVSLTSPSDGARFTAPVQIIVEADASDADGTVDEVIFLVGVYPIASDDTPPYTLTWNAPAGEHLLSAVVTDDAGALGSSQQITIEVEDSSGVVPVNVPPTVTFRQPIDGAELTDPVDVELEALGSDSDGAVVAVNFYVDGVLLGSDDTAPFTVNWSGASLGEHQLSAVAFDDGADTGSIAITVTVLPATPGEFVINDVQVGDPELCYLNPEFSDDGRYALWGERLHAVNEQGEGIVRMWHCEVDQNTGELIPWDCKGFAGFDSTNWGRAYVGRDSTGVFYLGANDNYELVMTRITGADSGVTTVVGSLVDTERRGIYPSVLPNSDKIYASWLKSHGPDVAPEHAEWVELRYVDIADPTHEIIVEHQDNTDGIVPIDVAFPRWAFHDSLLHYGHADDEGRVNLYQVDVSQPQLEPVQLTDDWHRKAGPYPVEFQGQHYILSAVDGTTENLVYREPPGGGMYEIVESFMPPANETFPDACLANSNEPLIMNDKLFTSFQVTDCAGGRDPRAFLSAPGEIWFTQLLDDADELWRLSRSSTDVKNEPEPVVGTSDAWVFYTSYPDGQDDTTACFQIRRAATPAALAGS